MSEDESSPSESTEIIIPSTTSLVTAVRQGDEETLTRLLSQGGAVDVHDNRGWFPLHEAAYHGCASCLQILLAEDDGNLINRQAWEGQTPFHLACARGNTECARVLVAAGADVSICMPNDTTPLLAATTAHSLECISWCAENGIDPNKADVSKWAPIHEACFLGFTEGLNLLLSLGVDKNVQNDDGSSPLFIAAQYGRQECLEVLLEAGADVNLTTFDGGTALYMASQEGYLSCVKSLLDAGAEIYTDSENGPSPVDVAALRGRTTILQHLVQAGADVKRQSEVGGVSGITPLHLAAQEGHTECAKVLLDAGADVNAAATSPGFATPLYLAVFDNKDKMCALLLEHGADPIHEKAGTVLLAAVNNLSVECAKVLLESNRTVYVKEDGNPLISSVYHNDFEMMELLVGSGLFEWEEFNEAITIALTRQYSRPQFVQRAENVLKVLLRACYKPPREILRDPVHPELYRLFIECQGNLARENCQFLQEKSKTTSDPQWAQLADTYSKPKPLQHQCRLVIRMAVGEARLSAIPSLDVPTMLKAYLTYESL